MTKAAEQCRIYVEEKYPGTPIGRFACRDTASGGISQHSAYKGYDSNALDIFGVGLDEDAKTDWIQEIVDDLNSHLFEWSGRKILWQQSNHWDHAHIDFYPMIQDHKWCGQSWTPEWKYSDGSTVLTRNPTPENGLYEGDQMEYRDVINVPDTDWARGVIDWGIEIGLIITTDNNPDDWNNMMSDGRFWTMLQRYDRHLSKTYQPLP